MVIPQICNMQSILFYWGLVLSISKIDCNGQKPLRSNCRLNFKLKKTKIMVASQSNSSTTTIRDILISCTMQPMYLYELTVQYMGCIVNDQGDHESKPNVQNRYVALITKAEANTLQPKSNNVFQGLFGSKLCAAGSSVWHTIMELNYVQSTRGFQNMKL